ncbi:hypothetical protein LX32DRAFT_637692 [Colletotrichum zoysiae]|uniref:Uncharacterized protein n=1 Tax=Colletotrichum zoysiae TaxID=1216348 RepID=A0AAD9HMI8_9PEZI|nr:hypothetical protein LX32DRAFT_637692 [Colletotrichum zoysiae]
MGVVGTFLVPVNPGPAPAAKPHSWLTTSNICPAWRTETRQGSQRSRTGRMMRMVPRRRAKRFNCSIRCLFWTYAALGY